MDKMSKGTEKCVQFLKEKYAIDISVYDHSFAEKEIKKRMAVCSCYSVDDYLMLLDEIPDETTVLLSQLSNSYSEFFRNPLTFAHLEQLILPALIGQKLKNKENEIRIWSAACASGQEVYSIAMMCDELVETTKTNIVCRIFATDFSEDELVKAQKGEYNEANLNKVTLKRIQKYFTKRGETYTVASKLRKYINFSFFDLLNENESCPPASIYGNFDLIFCTNLLFYYRPEYRRRILDKVGNCLIPGGYVVTGESEREIVRANNFHEIFINSAIFKKTHNR